MEIAKRFGFCAQLQSPTIYYNLRETGEITDPSSERPRILPSQKP